MEEVRLNGSSSSAITKTAELNNMIEEAIFALARERRTGKNRQQTERQQYTEHQRHIADIKALSSHSLSPEQECAIQCNNLPLLLS